MTIAVGIDAGFAIVGVAVIRIEGDTKKVIYHGTIETNPKDSTAQRLEDIQFGIKNWMQAISWGIDIVTIEIPFFSGNNSNQGVVHQGVGAIRLGLKSAGWEFPNEVQASQVKMAVARKGNASKVEVRKAIEQLFNVQFPAGTRDDAIDAVAIAYTGAIGVSAKVTHVKKSKGRKAA